MISHWNLHLIILAVLMALLNAGQVLAGTSSRSRAIDFEDELVEGMNKRPLDSVSQLGGRDQRRRRPHLYRKRTGFRDEIRETLQTAGYAR